MKVMDRAWRHRRDERSLFDILEIEVVLEGIGSLFADERSACRGAGE